MIFKEKRYQNIKKHYGSCFLGKINFYDEERKNIDTIEILKEYNGEKVYNFEYTFVVPVKDEELIELIRTYNKIHFSEALNCIDKIFNTIDELKGIRLMWV